MATQRSASPFLIAGALAGVAGMLTFLMVHHLWIQPIWFILPLGLVIAVAGGLAVGWAYYELAPNLPARPWTSLTMVGVIVVILLPLVILAEMRPPLYDISIEPAELSVSVGRAAAIFIGELLLTSVLAGALIGGIIGRTRRAAVATALAGLIFALGPGHNIPFIGSTPGVPKEVAIMAAVILVSSIVLVNSHRLLTNSQGIPGVGVME